MNRLIVCVLSVVFFPIIISFGGRDAITTGGCSILLLFFLFVVQGLLVRRTYRYIVFTISLIIISLVSAFAVPNNFLGPSLRSAVQFITSLMIFFVVFNYYDLYPNEERLLFIEKLISLIIFLFALQIIIGAILYFYPLFGKALSIFTARNQDIMVTSFASGAKRLECIIAGGEEIGEGIAVMFPLVLYKYLSKRDFINIVVIFIFIGGAILAATRSSIILILIGTLVFGIYNRKSFNLPFYVLWVYLSIVVIGVWLLYFPSIFDPILNRFGDFFNRYEKSGSLVNAINREGVWYYAQQSVLPNISLFGNGMVSIVGNGIRHFHNLYLTILHQLGLVGFVVLVGFFFRLPFKLHMKLKTISDLQLRALVHSCMLSMSIFLINEIKFEFNRDASYQQIVWILFAIFALVARLDGSNHNRDSERIVG